MKNLLNLFNGTIATMLIYLLGGWDNALELLITVIVLDYLTGLLKAIYNKKVNSIVGLKGIIKKVGYLIVVAIAVVLDRITGETGIIRNVVIYFFIANEGISILENWGGMGLPLPKKLFEVLEQLRKDSDSNDNNVKTSK